MRRESPKAMPRHPMTPMTSRHLKYLAVGAQLLAVSAYVEAQTTPDPCPPLCVDAYGNSYECNAPSPPPSYEQVAAASALPSVSRGLDRVRRLAAVAPTPTGPTSAGCLSGAHGAPLVQHGLTSVRDQLQRSLQRVHQAQQSGTRVKGLSVYASGQGESSEQSHDGVDDALRIRTTALTLGGDYRLNDQWVVGGALGLSLPRLRWAATHSRVDGNSVNANAYASWSPLPAFYVAAAAGLESSRYKLTTDMGTGTEVETKARARSLGLSLSSGYEWLVGNWSVSPFGRVDLLRSRVGSFENVGSRHTGRTSSLTAGVQTQTSIPEAWGLWVPYARVEFTHIAQWRLSGDSANAYQNATTTIPLPSPLAIDRNYGALALGSSAVLQGGLTLFADVETGFALRNVSAYRINLGLRTEL